MCKVDDRPGRRCCTETVNCDDVDCWQTVCRVDDEICVTGASTTRHSELDRAGNGLVEMVERSGGFVTDHRVLAEDQQSPAELKPV